MNDYKQELDNFANRLKSNTNSTPIQEVKPIKNSKTTNIIRATVHLPIDIHRKIKIHCVSNGISFKEYLTNILVREASKIDE